MFSKAFFWLSLVQIILAEWHLPYFIDTQTEGVKFQEWDGVQKINVREELGWPFILAKINYTGKGTPAIGSFDIGDKNLLGAKVIKTFESWLISIEKRQDYENQEQQIYSFQIYIQGSTNNSEEHGILMTLQNIFDNSPMLTYAPSPCRVKELQPYYITNCLFTVYDPDGMDKNHIRIIAEGPNSDRDLFEFIEYSDTQTFKKVFALGIKRELHYEERAVYNLDVRVFDANNNSANIFAILEVIDVPNRDPIWIRPLMTATFNEKEEQFFTVSAIDGDTGINKPICYRLEFSEDYSNLMSINETSGKIHIQPIDRDALNLQIFSFIICAYKCDNYTWAIKNTTILMVHDINDHIPEITIFPISVNILESKYMTLPLNNFIVEDMDLGSNATYDVFLDPTAAYSDAFYLIPSSGYQRANFSLTVASSEQLDYENENWRSFQLTIIARETQTLNHISNKTLQIYLINWNDEWPIFEHEDYVTNVLENVTKSTFIKQVLAQDRDIDDTVIHSIVGKPSGLGIDPITGSIFMTEDNIFDYERQTQVLLQVQAKDTLVTEYSQVLHTTYAQLTINIIDINDETPELRMPRSIVNIAENSPASMLLTEKIEARDPDTTANITFEILWNESYATKSGQEAERKYFVGCFIMESYPETKNYVYGHISINPEFKYDVDYEMYDTIFLAIKVTDLNQEINENSSIAILTVRIDDVNDNSPDFVVGTLTEPRKVTEFSEKFSIIGTILAFDIDGPGNNIISFDIRPIEGQTKAGLVTIDPETGVMRVNDSIQCDVPPIENLEYEVILTDSFYTRSENITIHIIDINNQVPEIESFEQQVAIYENATSGFFVGQIKAQDNDRDAPHNVLEYVINSANGDARNLFQINITNGIITVNLRNGLVLDRDNGIEYHYISVDVKDNFDFDNPGYGPVNQKSTFLNVTLLDVNDNAPIMPPSALFSPEFSEADLEGTVSKAQIIAKDIDEFGTPNSWVSYRILKITPAQDVAENVTNYDDIFGIFEDNQGHGQLQALKDLKGLYGRWQLSIEAYDYGVPKMSNSSTYTVYIRPFNFHAPVMVYPLANKSIRLCYSLQEPNRPLFQSDCVSRVQLFEAYDPDGGEYGDVTFQLSSDSGDDEYFKLIKEGRNQSALILQKSVPAGVYNINVRATDGGGSFSEEIRNLKLVFVDILGNPIFLENTFYTNFTENQDGLVEKRFIPAGYDPKNEGLDEGEDVYELYYFIDESYHPEEAKLFSLDKRNRSLTLNTMLDRESNDTHQLRIAVSNSPNGAQINPNGIKNMLDITITVNDVNDNPPAFIERFYAAGITPKDSIGKEILAFHAVDPDLDDPTSYMIDNSTLKTQGENIEYDKLQFFSINETTGVLSLSSYVQNNMKGYFMFDVEASDTADLPHTDKVQVKIYVVSELNRVKFVFLSDVQAIRNNEQFIREVFQEIYDYEICNIDAVEDVTNRQQRNWHDENNADAFISELIVHFINDNEAVDAAEIQKRSSDLAFISKLQNSLQRQKLILNNVPHLGLDEVTNTFDEWLLTALIVAAVLLAALCAILTLAFVLKTRALNRQLRAFESTKFGSIASDINRLDAPTTNIHAIEGSNPVINSRQFKSRVDAKKENTGFSYSSESDDDDDLNNLHDDPIFDMNTFKKNKTINDDVDIFKTSDYFNINNNTEEVAEKIRY